MKQAGKITLIYLIISIVWISVSDYIVLDSSLLLFNVLTAQTLKGYFFVFATSTLLFFLIDRLEMKQQKEINSRMKRESELEGLKNQLTVFKEVIDQSKQGIVLINPNESGYPITFVNRAYTDLTGFDIDEIIGQDFASIYSEEVNEKDILAINEVISNEKSLSITIPNYRKDGSFYWGELKLSPIYSASNELSYYHCIQNDVSETIEQKRLFETELKIFEYINGFESYAVTFQRITQLIAEHLQTDISFITFDKNDNFNVYFSSRIPHPVRHYFNRVTTEELKQGVFGSHMHEKKSKAYPSGLEMFFSDKTNFNEIRSVPLVDQRNKCIGILTLYFREHLTILPNLEHAFQSYQSLLMIALVKSQNLDQIKESERMYRLISDHSTDLVFVLNEQLEVEYYSPSVQKLLGDHITFKELIRALTDSDKTQFRAFIRLLKQTKNPDVIELELVNKDGSNSFVEVKGSAFFDHETEEDKLLFSSREITDRKKFEQALHRAVYFDNLTQLPNRFYLKKQVENMVVNESVFCLIMISFDDLSQIQQFYGIDVSQKVLKEVTKLITPYTFIKHLSRTGENEFSCIIEETLTEELLTKLSQVIKRIEEPWHMDTYDFTTTISVGASVYRNHSADQLLIEAEMALKDARTAKNQKIVIFKPDLLGNTERELKLNNDLYYAIQNKEFSLYYQPIVDTNVKRIYGFESLIRWNHPYLGLIMPNEFIPIAERSGKIVEIGYWVIEEALNQLNQWQREGHDFTLSVNISYRQLEEKTFVEEVIRLLKPHEQLSNRLVFEITESILVKDIALSNEVLAKLQRLGIRISVDDFGIGYSSLSYLKKFPVDILKIDRGFVKNMDEDSSDLAIIRAIMEMSKSLNLDVVAEGIETKTHLALLNGLACHYIQGYLYAKPLTVDLVDEQIKVIEKKLQSI